MRVTNRQIAVSWAKSMARGKNVLFLDTETTGFRSSDKVVDLGIIDNKGNTVVNLLLYPEMKMPEEASNVNGITDYMLKGCPRFVQVFTSIKKVMEGKTIIAWNSKFDQRMMENEFKNIGEEPPNCIWEDIMPMYAYYANKPKRNKLCIAAKECGIVEEQSHRAVGDCQFTLEVLKHMANN